MATATVDKPATQRNDNDESMLFRYRVLAGVHVEGKYTNDDPEAVKNPDIVGKSKRYGPRESLGDIVLSKSPNLLRHNQKGSIKYEKLSDSDRVASSRVENIADGLSSLTFDDLKLYASSLHIDTSKMTKKEELIDAIRKN